MTKTPTAERMPRAMILIYDERLGNSHWVDLMHWKRTRKTLELMLRKMVKAGEIVAWRLMHIEKEVMGNED